MTAPADAPAAAPSPAPRRSAVVAWSLYDLANTVFFLLVATRYFPEQLAALTGSESALAWAYVPAMLLSALLSPALGALVDRVGRARTLALSFTVVCCLATVAMARCDGAVALVVWFAVGRFAYEMAAVPYNALLPTLVGEKSVGVVSGIGVGLGYLGNLIAFALIAACGIDPARDGYGVIYLLAAVLFLLFTLPMRFCVPELATKGPGVQRGALLVASFRAGFAALRRQLAPPGRRAFFLGVFFACDAVNTVLAQVARYASQSAGLGFSNAGVNQFLLIVQFACIGGGFAFGRASDRIGGRRATLMSVGFLFVAFAAAQFTPWHALRVAAIATLGGAGLAGIWAASRHWLVQLVPAAERGEAFGVYGLAQRASLVTLWPFTALFDASVARGAPSYAGSVVLLLAALAAGFFCFLRTPARAS
ncbi:MAG: MFS transporter [Planctomycetes bacterium]|nr:MFS transporter [Planctomycetota bacterium]